MVRAKRRQGVPEREWWLRRTYCQVDLSTFCDFFRENSKKFQSAVKSAVPQCGANMLYDVLPL